MCQIDGLLLSPSSYTSGKMINSKQPTVSTWSSAWLLHSPWSSFCTSPSSWCTASAQQHPICRSSGYPKRCRPCQSLLEILEQSICLYSNLMVKTMPGKYRRDTEHSSHFWVIFSIVEKSSLSSPRAWIALREVWIFGTITSKLSSVISNFSSSASRTGFFDSVNTLSLPSPLSLITIRRRRNVCPSVWYWRVYRFCANS